MSSEANPAEGRRHAAARLLPSQGARPTRRAHRPVDLSVEGDELVLTMQVPEIEDAELRYSLRRRYLLVWGEANSSAHLDSDLVWFPRPVDPAQHSIRFQNGVLDVRARLSGRP